MDLDAYRARVEEALSLAAPEAPRTRQVLERVRSLVLGVDVRMRDERTVRVTDPLFEELLAGKPTKATFAFVRAHLVLLASQIEKEAHMIAGNPEAIKARARAILAQRQFRPPSPNPLQRFADWLTGLLRNTVVHVTSAASRTWWVAWLGVALVTAALLIAFRKLAGRIDKDASIPVPHAAVRSRTSAEWIAEAARLETDGHYREAIRARYRAALRGLAEAGLVDERPGRTAREYREELTRCAPQAGPAFARATEIFEGAWYGQAKCRVEDGAALTELASSALADAQGSRR